MCPKIGRRLFNNKRRLFSGQVFEPRKRARFQARKTAPPQPTNGVARPTECGTRRGGYDRLKIRAGTEKRCPSKRNCTRTESAPTLNGGVRFGWWTSTKIADAQTSETSENSKRARYVDKRMSRRPELARCAKNVPRPVATMV